jgi:hypothetical protein
MAVSETSERKQRNQRWRFQRRRSKKRRSSEKKIMEAVSEITVVSEEMKIQLPENRTEEEKAEETADSEPDL